MENKETIINRIFYLSYKYHIRDMEFIWEERIFNPTTKKDQEYLENASLEVLNQILEKYLEASEIIYKIPDDRVYSMRQIKKSKNIQA